MSEIFNEDKAKKELLKNIIKRLHEGESPDDVKDKFREIIKRTTPTEISKIEEELINEGMPREQIQKLCNIHLEVFKESLGKKGPLAEPGHPVYIQMQEHDALLKFADELKRVAGEIKKGENFGSVMGRLQHLVAILDHFRDAEKHYLREENVLFPYIEKHGITQPPKIMWMEHDEIREIEKRLYNLAESREMEFKEFASKLNEDANILAEKLNDHFYKENNVLFPTSIKVIEPEEWKEIRKQFDEIGYCCFSPKDFDLQIGGSAIAATKNEKMEEEKEKKKKKEEGTGKKESNSGVVAFETGTLSKEELEAIFGTLPVDLSFVDKNDTLKFFSESKNRIFLRTKAVIGRKVQNCHPQKSVHIVEKILDDFRNGKRESAEFWIPFQEKMAYIRYFPVRNKDGEYLGCLEVVQDIRNIQKIEGEKRLLDD